VKNTTTYKQYDSRWRWWVYPKKSWYLNGCGCGCLSVFHCVLELNKYLGLSAEALMRTVYNYMKQFAVAGDGTKRDGITAGLKHFGFKDVFRCGDKPMSELFKRLDEKGDHVGVLVFGKVSKGKTIPCYGPDGTLWTKGGHYIAYNGYRVRNGQHEFHMMDSGSRNHSGWYSYEKSMRGCVMDAWCATVPEAAKTTVVNDGKAYTGDLPSVNDGWRLIDEAAANKGKYKTRTNGGKDGKKYSNKFTKYFAGKGGIDSKGQMPNVYGYIPGYCTLFVVYCLVKIGLGNLIPFSTLNSKKNGYWWHAPSLMKYFKKKGWLVTNVKYAKVGAVAFKGKGKSPTHTCIFVKYSGGWVYTWDGNVGGGVTYNKRRPSAFCGFANLPYKSYFGVGAKGVDVLEWQKYLNWDFGYGGTKVVAEDSDFGKFTEAYTKEFQKAAGLTADGTVGYQTVAKAKAVRK